MPDGSELAVEAALEACVEGWTDTKARTRAAKQLGLAIDNAAAHTLTIWLSAANASRKLYTLPLADLLRALVEARTAGIAVRHGGKGGPHAMTPSTIALAVRIDDVLHVAISTANARSPSPGIAWKILAPWQQDMAKNMARARVWAARPEPRKVAIPIVKQATLELRQSRVTRDAVLAEVLARPREDEPRLVYADTLTAKGDPRGEFIVVQCALAAGSTDPKLVKRETALRRKHGAAWMKEVKQLARGCELRRGFVASMTMKPSQFAQAGKLFDKEPIEELVLVDVAATSLGKLAVVPHLARLDRIILADRAWIGNAGHLRGFQSFLRALGNARHLRLDAGYWREVDVTGMFDGVEWPNVETLSLALRGEPPMQWAALCRAHIPKLRELAIAPFGDDRELRAAFPAATIKSL